MALLASEVMDHAAATYLNDPSKGNYTYAKLLPHLQAAMLELQSSLVAAGISTVDITSATLSLPTANSAISSTTTPALPTDLIVPIELYERREGGTEDEWDPIDEAEELPHRLKENTLGVYTWENEQINFVGCLVIREVRIKYQRSLEVISGSTSPINTLGAKLFLSARTAALAALFIGRNSELSGAANSVATAELTKFMTARIKETQNFPARRLPYNYARRAARRRIARGR